MKIMTRVLLITDIQRVQRVFDALETKKILELRISATLTLADLDLSSFVPEFTFVQSRISGFSGLIMLRYLKKSLPKDAKIIMLAGDAEDVALAKKLAVPFIDLADDDEALAVAITTVLGGKRRSAPKKAAAGETVGGAKSRTTKAVGSKPKAVSLKAVPPVPDSEETAQSAPDSVKTVKPVLDSVEKVEPVPASTGTVKPLTLQAPEKSEDEQEPLPDKQKSFTQQKIENKLIREPLELPVEEEELPVEEVKLPIEEGELPVEEADTLVVKESAADVQSGNAGSAKKVEAESFEEIMRQASDKGAVPASASPVVEDSVDVARDVVEPMMPGHEKLNIAVPLADFVAAEEISEQIRRSHKKKHLLWVIPLALILVLIPLLSYLAGQKAATPNSLLAPKGRSHPAPREVAKPVAKEVAKPAATEATQPVAKEAPKPSANAAAKPAPVPAAKPLPGQTTNPVVAPGAKPVAKEGLKTLPPVVADTKPDLAYGKAHPGWSRFVGNKVEYKLFKEGELYKALQVIPLRGQTISDPFFKRVLLEFGGTDRCQLESTGKKGDFVMEQCVAKGGVAVTTYRNKDHEIKGFVLYYR